MVGLVIATDEDEDEDTTNIEFVLLYFAVDVAVDVAVDRRGKEEEELDRDVREEIDVVDFVFFSFLGILLKRGKII
jgi:hypothetical protein